MNPGRLRRFRDTGDEGGFALIFVMLVSMVIMAGVATTLNVTTPNILAARTDQDSTSALAAAQSGVDDVLAYLLGQSACRSTTKICPQALGADSTTLNRPGLTGTNQSFTWTTDPTLTADEYVRVHSTGQAGNVSKSLTADISLAPSILSFGYYTNYESQSPTFLYDYYAGRRIAIADSNEYSQINAYNNQSRTITVSSPTSVTWNGPATSGSNPYPASICGQHWYYDSASSPGRYNYGANSVWGETGSINSNNVTRTSSCDVVFTSGMTLDGPIYTRDAMLISDGTNGGVGPIFKQPVYTLWGFHGYDTPTPPATPWRRDAGVGGNISSTSPYSPKIAGLDLQLPETVGTDGLASNNCVYKGPTRVKLNGNGTATVTSPFTTTRNGASDTACYPTGSLAGGIVNFVLNYKTTGAGTIYVQDLGTAPSTGWPEVGMKATTTPSASSTVVYLPTSGGATAPDVADNSAAASSCSSSARYSNVAASPCAWTGVYANTDLGTGTGWSSYTASTCSAAATTPVNRELFECEYGQQAGSANPAVNQTGGNYAAFRGALQADLAKGTCLTSDIAAQTSCVQNLINADLKPANSGQRAYNTGTPAAGEHRYAVTATTTNTVAQGTATPVGAAPANPMSADPMFSYTGTPSQEAATKTPITFSIGRQTYTGGTWGSTTPQFTVTDTQSDWKITAAATGASYFPDTNDVTTYSTGANAAGLAAGATGANQPGDLYVEGTNSGKLSMIAQDDVVVTNDITDSSTDPNVDAVDIVAGGNVRNYHPVKCVDQTPADLAATDPGWCPNDITGLYNNVLESNGTLYSSHPAVQYTNMTTPGARRIDAALFALSGSFLTDNYNRGLPLGPLTVNGGIYQSHRGANGVQWEYTGSGARPSSGFSLQYHYVDLERANLPYAPPATGGSNSRVWNVVSISAGS